MKRYGRIQGLVLALASASFYRDVARNWRGIGLLYVLLLMTLTWIPVLIKWQVGYGRFVRDEVPKVLDKLPPIAIVDGKISSPVPQPYTVNDPDTGKTVFILDTTGAVTSLEGSPAQALLTETKLYVRSERKTEIHDLSELPDMTISKESVGGWLDAVGKWLGLGLFPFVMIGSLVRALVLMLAAAVVGLIVNASFPNARLGFAALLRLAAVGLTLSVYLDTGLSLVAVHVPYWFVIALLLTVGYVAFGVKAAAVAVLAPALDADFDDRPMYPTGILAS